MIDLETLLVNPDHLGVRNIKWEYNDTIDIRLFQLQLMKLSNLIVKRTLRSGGTNIILHSKLKPLFTNLSSFTETEDKDMWGTLQSRWRVWVDDRLDSDLIIMTDNSAWDYMTTGWIGELEDMGNFEFRHIKRKLLKTDDDFETTVANHIGYLNVLNYTK